MMTELIATPLTGDEKEILHGFLNSQRDVILWKLEGLNDADVRRKMTPSLLSLLGLVKHVASAEHLWFCHAFGRKTDSIQPLQGCDPWSPHSQIEEEKQFLIIDSGETTEEILAYYASVRAACDDVIAELDLNTTGTAWTGETVTLRWALTHIIEETARHAGHADIIRELIDNTTGYKPPQIRSPR